MAVKKMSAKKKASEKTEKLQKVTGKTVIGALSHTGPGIHARPKTGGEIFTK